MTAGYLSPFSRLALFLALIVLAVSVTIAVALRQPSTSLQLAVRSSDGGVAGMVAGRPVSVVGLFRSGMEGQPGRQISRGDFRALAERRPMDAIVLEDIDFQEDPDMLASYAAFNRFMSRQGQLAGLLSNGVVGVAVTEADTALLSMLLVPVGASRSLSDLPPDFWVQTGAAVGMLLVAAFLKTLRPHDGPSTAFALSGVGAASAALTAAIYSTRDVALDPGLFQILSGVNQSSTFLFGIAAMHLFALYPVRLFSAWRLWPASLACVLLIFLYRSQTAPIEFVSPHIGVIGLLVGIVVLVALQYRATRADPANRAIMLWIGMSVVLGAGSFVLLVTAPLVLGRASLTSQSAGFVPLAAIYAAIAIGVLRFRLFDLGRWAYRLILYTSIIVGVLVLDLAIALALSLSPANSLGIAVLAIGLIYLLCRDYVFDRLLSERRPELAGLYKETVAIAFQPTAEAKERSWVEAVQDHFTPLHCEAQAGEGPGRPRLLDDGIAMIVPAYDWSRALKLRLAGGGKRLFDLRDLALVEQLADLVRSAEADRLSYEQGVAAERRRIAMDLHDDVAATLLSGLHARDERQRRDTIMDALVDIRQIASGLAGREMILSHFIGHLRHTSRNRAELHGFSLQWPIGAADDCNDVLAYQFHRNFAALHREALSNALKHGRAGGIDVHTAIDGDMLVHIIGNDTDEQMVPGVGDDPELLLRRHGAGNMRMRAARLGGELGVVHGQGRFVVTMRLPLRQQEGEDRNG